MDVDCIPETPLPSAEPSQGISETTAHDNFNIGISQLINPQCKDNSTQTGTITFKNCNVTINYADNTVTIDYKKL